MEKKMYLASIECCKEIRMATESLSHAIRCHPFFYIVVRECLTALMLFHIILLPPELNDGKKKRTHISATPNIGRLLNRT